MTVTRKWFCVSATLILVLIAVVYLLLFKSPLTSIHRVIERDYTSVMHISALHFTQLNSDDVLLFDVRETEEFSVSHIAGAIQVDPDIEISEFIEEYGGLLQGKRVVFYCSVGRRSSALASKLGNVPSQYGAISSQNLIGGIFSWVNQGRKLRGSLLSVTTKVHPYNDYWGRLVEDQNNVRYSNDL